MNNLIIRKPNILAALCALALGGASVAATAESNPTHVGYLTDTAGMAVLNGYGGCWRTGQGPASMPRVECGDAPAAAPVAQVAPAPVAKVVERAPKVVEPAPTVAATTPQPVAMPVVQPTLAPKPERN